MSTQTPVVPPMKAPRRRTDDLLALLADRIGAGFTASTVFGAPVERGGVTVIPAAAMALGFGGGAGTEAGSDNSGEGGGGGGRGTPVGYIEIKDGRSRFVPVVNPARMAVLGCATLLVLAAILRR